MCNPAAIGLIMGAATAATSTASAVQQGQAAREASRAALEGFSRTSNAISQRTVQEQDAVSQRRFENQVESRRSGGAIRALAGARGAAPRTVRHLVRSNRAAFGRTDARLQRQGRFITTGAALEVDRARASTEQTLQSLRFNTALQISTGIVGAAATGYGVYSGLAGANAARQRNP